MSFFGRARRWLEDGFRQPQDEISKLQRFIVLQLKLYLHVARETIRGAYLQRAAALSFATLLALIPLTTLLFSLCVAFTGTDRQKMERLATDVLRSYFLAPGRGQSASPDTRVRTDIPLLPLPAVGPPRQPMPSGQPTAVLVPGPVPQVVKERPPLSSEDEVTQWGERIAAAVTALASRASSTEIRTAGAVLFIVVCVLLFNAIEGGFNAIWHVRSRRRFWMKSAVFCAVLLLGPLLIAASVYLSTYFAAMRQYLGNTAFASGTLERFALLLPPLLITWLAFFLAYMIIPHARVTWKNALAGSLVAALLWEVAKHGFRAYVAHMVTYRRLYGSLAAIPIFMLWIFITWVIVLFGAGVTYTSQHLGALENRRRRDREGGTVSPHLALSLVLEVARRFEDGLGTTAASDLAQVTGTSEDEIRDTLRPLVSSDILTLSLRKGFQYQPARPLDKIPIASVLGAIREKDAAGALLPMHRETVFTLMGKSRGAEERELQGVTLRDLVTRLSGQESPLSKGDNRASADRC